ncbi:MAG: acetoacetyl-CoA reductase [Arenicellales bacterium]|jgi:acetoacetyl-CoA reductase|nr:beta-ketoacyl-ACP reductase [Acidiferrobacteraceae bacterium]MDP6123210.1 acetoacetyl-CoA reductase [Arenicellales bacterium]MBT59662.1 beta-ketoacyl-ACP reductase [Acidiferrobacteraceae bacterium]MDP6290247.1 acetoacetyl-CoA reductase [Arenicellales bacterium]MDP6435309.1 acetoacetyl-CoA reductase [Arenicellales bacterium]|tara:strand:+ start:2419 stop:3156 length:738 start_codon:yes stop_codon:yes gene_type:complete
MGTLEGKIALVTGGTGGIGTAICQRLAADGARIVTTYMNQEKAEKWQADQDFESTIIRCDVGSYEDCERLREQIESELGHVDLIVNNAGITRDGSFKKMNADKWSQVIATNLDSVFNVTHQFANGMAERGHGRIVNISSINGQKGQFGQTNYSAAKAGLHGFSMALAQEVARKGVTVNTVSPGYIATEMVMAVPEEIRDKIIAQIPVGRLGKPEEIAALIAFLCSDEGGFITGANLAANGGQHMH